MMSFQSAFCYSHVRVYYVLYRTHVLIFPKRTFSKKQRRLSFFIFELAATQSRRIWTLGPEQVPRGISPLFICFFSHTLFTT